MITAKQAKELAGPNVNDYLNTLSLLIEQAATNKNFFVVVQSDPYKDWLSVPQNQLKGAEIAAINRLRAAGFNLSVDPLGLKISWS